MNLQKAAGAGLSALLLLLSPGGGCFEALAQVRIGAAPLPPLTAPSAALPSLSPLQTLPESPLELPQASGLEPLKSLAPLTQELGQLQGAAPKEDAPSEDSAGHGEAVFRALVGARQTERGAVLAAAPEEPPAQAVIRKELKRKAFHLGTIAYLGAYKVLGPEQAVVAMGGFSALVALAEVLRLKSPTFNRLVMKPFQGMMREHEATKFSGLHYATLGAFLTMALFGSNPAVITAAMLSLTFGDAAAAVVGKIWGRHKWPGSLKSIEGSLACALACFAAGLAAGLSWPAALAAGIAVAAVELAPVPFDDNLWIPLGAALAAWLALY